MPQETQQTITQWAYATFGEPPPAVAGARANEEMAEMLGDLASGQPPAKIAEEAADVYIVLCHMCSSLGEDLHEHIDRKMGINRKRKWQRTASGIGQHIPDDIAEALEARASSPQMPLGGK